MEELTKQLKLCDQSSLGIVSKIVCLTHKTYDIHIWEPHFTFGNV